MTNPNNAIGTNGAYSGRTSVDAFNDILSAFSGRGIVSGWSVSPSSGMTITLGGVSGIRDVAIAVATGGAKTTINNRSGSPVSLTIEAAPATNSRIDAIVAYVSNPPQGTTELADNPSACGLIAVKGTVASTPTAPTESTIRTAITADGAVGSTAYYVVLGTVKVVAGATTLTSNYITQGAKAVIGTDKIADSAVTTAKIANSAVTSDKIDFTTFTRKFEWFSRDNTGASQTITSPRGNTYTIKTVNGGSGFKILSGGNKILAFRAIVNVQMSTTDMTDAYGVQGIALDSTVYTRGYGRLNNGAASTMNVTATTAIGTATEAYTSIGDNAGAKYSTQIEQTGVRVRSSYWRIFGKIASTGCVSTLSFDCEYTAQSNSVFGSVYQRGANVNTTTAGSGFIWVEFIESD